MLRPGHPASSLRSLVLVTCMASLLSSCYFVNFFTKKDKKQSTNLATATTGGVLGAPLGPKAGELNEAALQAVHNISSSLPPAPIRPDPDLYARRLFLQYREEGSTVARQIGSIEAFRLLMGGASDDFQKPPQEGFDATSLLAQMTVAEQICTGLVAPNSREQEGWETILPAAPGDWETNIRFLAQRFLGKPSDQIESAVITDLKEIFDAYNSDGNYSLGDYVPVCTTLAMDAEALWL